MTASPIDGLPFSQACENNKLPILEILQRHLEDAGSVLEIAGGTGQHAVFFAEALPHLIWQSTDVPHALDNLTQRIAESELPNLPEPAPLDVNAPEWGVEVTEAVFSANCLHIIAASSVENFFAGVGRVLQPGGKLFVYGPFRYGGEFTSESNANFDGWLKARDPGSGIRDFEWVNGLAATEGLTLLEDNAMPANNQLLLWQRAADIQKRNL